MTAALLASLCISGLAGAQDAITPGKLDVDPPTLIGLGFQLRLSGDENRNASLEVEYRKVGQEDWTPGLKPYYETRSSVSSFGSKFDVEPHFAGSVIDLMADTAYEVRLTLSDPDGVEGEAQQTFKSRTRKVPEACSDGRVVEVFPDRDGRRLEDVLGDLKPGDIVKLHGGTYSPPAFQAPPSPKSSGGEKVAPGDGEVRHVYPPRYKGKKLEPNYPNIMAAYHGGRWLYDVNFYDLPTGVKPGDTIVVHAGRYVTSPMSYRNPLALWQHGRHRFTREGEPGKPITIKAAGDGPVVLDGGGAYCMFDLTAAKHHVVDGLTLTNAFIAMRVGAPAKKQSAQGLVIQGCKIENVRAGIVGAESAELRLIDTTIEEGAFADRKEGTYLVTADGTSERPITFQPAGDGEVIIDGGDNFTLFDVMAADHLIFEDLTFRNTLTAIDAGRRGPGMGSRGLTVRNCRFLDVQNGVFGLSGACRSFTILDNVFIGRTNPRNPGGYAVNLCGAGHAVGYNYSKNFWDHLNVSTSSTVYEGNRAWSMDFYNNICIRGRDNIFEVDGSMWNVRVMRNLCSFSNSFAFSSQPTLVGPTYYIRNVLYWGGGFKFVMGSRGAHAWHNTLIGNLGIAGGHAVNNLALGKTAKHTRPDGADFSVFVDVPKPDWENYPRRGEVTADVLDIDFGLAEGSMAIDAGQVIPGYSMDYEGKAPDLGAREHGRDAPRYGPRTQKIPQ
jgi:hypothetical protein